MSLDRNEERHDPCWKRDLVFAVWKDICMYDPGYVDLLKLDKKFRIVLKI